jgi:hypothetical protein
MSDLSPRGLCDFGLNPHHEELTQLTLTALTKLQPAHRQHTLIHYATGRVLHHPPSNKWYLQKPEVWTGAPGNDEMRALW